MPRDWPIFAVAGAAILIWIRRVVEFRKSCNGKPGWIAALFRYQAIVIVLLFGVVLLFYGTSKLASLLFGGDCDPTIYLAVMPAPVALIVTVAVWWYRPMHRWMMRRVVRLQREVAVEIARQRVRHQMYRQHRRSDHP